MRTPLTSDGHAEVGHYSLGHSEIIEGQNDNVAMTLDLSSITVPEAVPRKDSQSCLQNIRLPRRFLRTHILRFCTTTNVKFVMFALDKIYDY
jgi:hypothetical protein